MLTNDDIKKLGETFATKEDLRNITDDLMELMRLQYENIDNKFDKLSDKFDKLTEIVIDVKEEQKRFYHIIESHDGRITRLESKVFPQ